MIILHHEAFIKFLAG